ncbi:hypothetical protein [Prosthecomicrobium sp. N25]|uniref:hypothetical protein n=1 Tax=Prosthecomicrobium sp. N25 TaxID=3129254 RepID=UPI0030773D25
MIRRFAAALLASSVLAATTPASAGILDAILLGQPSDVPVCHDPAVIGEIHSKFQHADREVLKRGLVLETVDRIQETYFGQLNAPGSTLRRFCKADAHISDRRHPSALYYLIEQDYGFVGITWNVEFCVIGYEPWRVHDGNCRTVRKWW